MTANLWTVDGYPGSGGFATIRPADGSPHGDTEAQPIATVYLDAHARLIAATLAKAEETK